MTEANRAMTEVWPVRDISHDNLVKYLDVYFEDLADNLSLCIAMDYYPEGDFQNELNRRITENQKFTQPELLGYMCQLASGLAHLHEKRIIHRDLKPMNIFKNGPQLLLGDFGLSKKLDSSVATTQAGTPKYMAPEIFGKQPYGLKADIWSLGVCFYSMIILNLEITPYLEVYMNANFHAQLDKQIVSLGYSEQIANLVNECLSVDPECRPSASDLETRLIKLSIEGDSNYMEKNLTRRNEFTRLIDLILNPTVVPETSKHIYDSIAYRDMLYAVKQYDIQMKRSIVVDEANYFDVFKQCLLKRYGSNITGNLIAVVYAVGCFPDEFGDWFKHQIVLGGEDSIVYLLKTHPDPVISAKGREMIETLRGVSLYNPELVSVLRMLEGM
jgi:serine/threonine protein kinase